VEEHIRARLYALAAEYIENLDRDKRIVAARYIADFRERPERVCDMGFLQYATHRWNGEEKIG
jgi:hypothetical protein